MPLAPRLFLLISLALAASVNARAQEATPTPNETAGERVYTFEEVTKPAVIVRMPDPVYFNTGPKMLDRAGAVKVGVVLSASGRVRDAQILEGLSQNQNFATLKAARRIVFIPALKNGVPVSQYFVASYSYTVTTPERGRPEELKGLTKFYVDTGGDREALGYITGELQKKLPRLVIVDRPEEAECILSTDHGQSSAFRPLAPDKRHVFLYYVGITFKVFARSFVYEYKKANGIDD